LTWIFILFFNFKIPLAEKLRLGRHADDGAGAHGVMTAGVEVS